MPFAEICQEIVPAVGCWMAQVTELPDCVTVPTNPLVEPTAGVASVVRMVAHPKAQSRWTAGRLGLVNVQTTCVEEAAAGELATTVVTVV